MSMKLKQNLGRLVVIAGFLAAVIAIYEFMTRKGAAVEFQLLRRIDVNQSDLAEGSAKLLITQAGIKNHEMLRLYTLRVYNGGGTGFAPADFDTNMPWGLRITAGRAIWASPVRSSDEYLRDNAAVQILNGTNLRIKPVVFNRNANFEFDVYVVHSRTIEPLLEAIGKIRDVEALAFRDMTETRSEMPLLIRDLYSNSVIYRVYFYLSHAFLPFWLLFVICAAIWAGLRRHVLSQGQRRPSQWG